MADKLHLAGLLAAVLAIIVWRGPPSSPSPAIVAGNRPSCYAPRSVSRDELLRGYWQRDDEGGGP